MKHSDDLLRRVERAMISMRRVSFQYRPDSEDLKPPQFFILSMLSDRDKSGDAPPTVSDVAEKVGVSNSAITQQVNDLVKRGVIERQIAENDRRNTYIILTKKGRRMMKSHARRRREKMAEIFEVLGPDDSIKLIEIIEKINGYMRENRKRRRQ